MAALRKPMHELYAQNRAKGMGRTQAFVHAGGKAKNPNNAAACLENRNAHIMARVNEILAMGTAAAERYIEQSAVQSELNRDWVLTELRKQVERCTAAVPVTDRQGFPTGEYRIEANAANRALELIGKELGMFVERKESGKPGAFKDDTERKAAQQRIVGKLVKLGVVRVMRSDKASVENSTDDRPSVLSETQQSEQKECVELPTVVHQPSAEAKVESDPTPLPPGLNPNPDNPNPDNSDVDRIVREWKEGTVLDGPSPLHHPVPPPADPDQREAAAGSGGLQTSPPSSDSA